jgi:hypothetical protein
MLSSGHLRHGEPATLESLSKFGFARIACLCIAGTTAQDFQRAHTQTAARSHLGLLCGQGIRQQHASRRCNDSSTRTARHLPTRHDAATCRSIFYMGVSVISSLCPFKRGGLGLLDRAPRNHAVQRDSQHCKCCECQKIVVKMHRHSRSPVPLLQSGCRGKYSAPLMCVWFLSPRSTDCFSQPVPTSP